MVGEIRIYLEGGGDQRSGKGLLRRGFHEFLREVIDEARSQRIRFSLIACGPRSDAFEDFSNALATHPDSFNLLLVDSEEPVENDPWDHLLKHDGWTRPRGVDDRHCHLMVQMMEAWFVADLETLEDYYGAGFNRNPIPNNPDVEQISKSTVESSLKTATRNTSKGEYHKIHHASDILECLSVETVQQSAKHCRRLFETLEAELEHG